MTVDGATHSGHTASDEQPRKGSGLLIGLYIGGMVAVFASAIIVVLALGVGGWFWPLTLLGAVVICTLLSAGVLPHFQQER